MGLAFTDNFLNPAFGNMRNQGRSHPHGAAQTRRGRTDRPNNIFGAPRFSPYRLWPPFTPNMIKSSPGRTALNPHDAETLDAVFERMFPADNDGPGATEIGVTDYVDKALTTAYSHLQPLYRAGLVALDRETLSPVGKALQGSQSDRARPDHPSSRKK